MNEFTLLVDVIFGADTGYGFDTPHPCRNSAFGNDLEVTDITRGLYMRAAAKLFGEFVIKSNYADILTVFLTKQSGHTALDSDLVSNIAFLFQRDIFTDLFIYDGFDLSQFIVGYFGEMREVETQ